MTLRLELQLFLWVTALALVGFTLFRGSPPVSPVTFVKSDVDSTLEASGSLLLVHTDQPVELLPDDTILELLSRPIFPAPVAEIELPSDEVTASVRVLPILKGIIASDTELRAVFASSDDPYLVVGTGEAIAEFIVTSISTDQVTARDDRGGTQIFALRGSGEN